MANNTTQSPVTLAFGDYDQLRDLEDDVNLIGRMVGNNQVISAFILLIVVVNLVAVIIILVRVYRLFGNQSMA